VLWTSDGPLFIDFEAACAGPLEWDIAYLPAEARGSFLDYNEDLVELLRQAISFCVAAWCWAQFGRAPELDEAALYHLDVLRKVYGMGTS
jgi:thiamine kinase-like enzyme